MVLSTSGYGGRTIKETIKIHTNDPVQPVIRVAMTGFVKKFVVLKPGIVRLRGRAGQTIKSKITITPTENNQFRILKIFAKNKKHIKYEIKKIGGPLPYYELIVENTKKEPGRYFDVITIQTDLSPPKSIRIHVSGNITD